MDLSIVIPTYNEKDNVGLLVKRIQSAMEYEHCLYEVIFVDDSTDDTPLLLDKLMERYSNVKYVHRKGERGLASAVVNGLNRAQGERIIVMDADLQHPPELIPLIFRRLTTADIVIPSRFISGGFDGGLDFIRKFISWTARMIGRFFLKKLRHISDCTSGFFGLRRTVLDGATLNPIGWKILMEVLVRGTYRTIHEIPYSFAMRDAGSSKMCWQEQCNYLRHIGRLINSSPEDLRFIAFCTIGLMGVFINLICLKLLLSFYRFDDYSSSVFASMLAMLHNFILNDKITWRDQKNMRHRKRLLRVLQFSTVSGVGIMITAMFAHIFAFLRLNIIWGQLTGIICATYWNYTINSKWTWCNPATKPEDECHDYVVTREY